MPGWGIRTATPEVLCEEDGRHAALPQLPPDAIPIGEGMARCLANSVSCLEASVGTETAKDYQSIRIMMPGRGFEPLRELPPKGF